MKNAVTNTEKQVNNVVNKVNAPKMTRKIESAKIESKSINLLNAVKNLSEKKAKIESNFKKVQVFNREFKEEFASLGRILSNLIQFDKETKGQKLEPSILAKIKVCKENKNSEYTNLAVNIKPNSKGLYSSYKVLMFLRK